MGVKSRTVVLLVELAPGPSTATPLNGCLVKVIGKDKTTFALPFPHCLLTYGNPIMTSNTITYNYYIDVISILLIYYRIS